MTDATAKADAEQKIAQLEAMIAQLREQLAHPGSDDQQQPEDPGRRSMLAPLAMLGLVGAMAAAPKDAQAQDYQSIFDGVRDAINGTIANPIHGSFSLAVTAYSLLHALGISPQIMSILQCLGLFGGFGFNVDFCSLLQELVRGEGSMQTTGRIDPTMEELWHADVSTTAEGMDDATVTAYETYFQQVRGSQGVTASSADAMPAMAAGDDIQLAALNAAARGGHLIEVNARLGHLIWSTNRHLAMVIKGQNAQQQTLGSQLMASQHQRYARIQGRRRMREPTEGPVPGPQVTGSSEG